MMDMRDGYVHIGIEQEREPARVNSFYLQLDCDIEEWKSVNSALIFNAEHA